jgi:hypothetical protein
MIVKVDPPDAEHANIVQVDSDARDNMAAMREIEDWAEERGFVRTNEYWLRRVLVNGKTRFRGICYRLVDEELASARQDLDEIAKRRERMPEEVLTDH